MKKGTDKGKYDSALLTSVHSFYSEIAGTAYQNHWMIQVARIRDCCDIWVGNLIAKSVSKGCLLSDCTIKEYRCFHQFWYLKELKQVKYIQKCITNLSPSDCVLFGSLKDVLWPQNSRMI